MLDKMCVFILVISILLASVFYAPKAICKGMVAVYNWEQEKVGKVLPN